MEDLVEEVGKFLMKFLQAYTAAVIVGWIILRGGPEKDCARRKESNCPCGVKYCSTAS